MAQSLQSDTEGDEEIGEVTRAVTLPRGTVLDGTYRVEEQLGAGAGGAVYRAVHLELQRSFAVKVLEDELDADAARRLAQEARTTSAIEHDHIVGITHLGRDATGRLYVVMELLDGEDLRARLERQPPGGGGLPLGEAKAIVAQALEGLAAAHEAGVIHRDIKPANIFLAQKRGEVVVKLVDFGMSRQLHGQVRVTQTGALIGTPLYMAPEQSNNVGVDARADVYSLGVVAYEVLAGRAPFEADTLYACVLAHALTPPPPLRELRSDVPEAVAAVVHRCLEKSPEDRYNNAAAAARAWALAWDDSAAGLLGPAGAATPALHDDDALQSGVTTSRRPGPGAPADGAAPGAVSRSRRPAALIGVVGVLAAALLLGWWGSRDATPAASTSTSTSTSTPSASASAAGTAAADSNDAPTPTPAAAGTPAQAERGATDQDPGAPEAAPAAQAIAPPSATPPPTLRTITSAPTGATLSAPDGTVLGVTPFEVDVSAGPVELRLTLAGHVPSVHVVSADTASTLTIPLQRAAAARRGPRPAPPLPMLAPR